MTELRRKAQARRVALGLDLDAPTPAGEVAAAGLAATGLERCLLPPGDALLAGAMAVLNREANAIFLNETRPAAARHFDTVHELAHFWLHGEGGVCAPEDLDPARTGEESEALRKVDGYSPAQKREAEANGFAAELLLPGPLARRLFLDEGLPAEAIADRLELPAGMVQMQLADALLLPPLTDFAEAAPTAASAEVTLDESQLAAAHLPCGPLLLGAGPGTGKTKTLVGRCRFLAQDRGVPPEQILALTFSRKAAGEMRERLLAAGVGTRTAGPWVGTFHAFGLDLLRRFGDRLGLIGEIKLLARIDAVTLLENHLAELGLDALDNLYDPAMHLGGILGQIGRAKDELCPPDAYARLCAEMGTCAEADAAKLAARTDRVLKREQDEAARGLDRAARAAEVARCYHSYERLLREGGYLDFGDLIVQSVRLLEAHPDVLATLHSEYPHVLADEYQDVNRACARLVRLLAGPDARGLWAVGDHRQSIYQFQGASPANVAAFGRDYPTGQRLELGVNYRSRRPIVDLFGAAAGGGAGWHAHRGVDEAASSPAVIHAAAPDPEGQADGIAQAVRDLRAGGWAHRQQAILCRSHAQAEALAAQLSARDIPTLYLGTLLERPEVKDLLCLLSLLADPGGTALVRVASFPEYAVPPAEALAVVAQMRREERSLLDALQDPERCPGLRRLAAHLAELETMENDPAALLRHYLFGLSDYLRGRYGGEPKPFVRLARGLALHQLLGLAAGFRQRLVAPRPLGGPPQPVRDFLAHLRRLDAAGDGPRGTLPDEAEALDAVRLLTAHAAKGLEYPVVFLPNLGAGQFPTRGRSDGIPTPPGLTDTAGPGAGDGEDDAIDEEACLFFVALSRARDHLILSRAQISGAGKAVEPSPLLCAVLPHLDAAGIAETVWPAGRPAPDTAEEALAPPDSLPEYSLSALETYMRCPRQYFYAQEMALPGTFFGGGYPQFHACVRQTLSWREDAREQGRTPSPEEMAAHLETIWAAHGPVGHLHEAKYKQAAQAMLAEAAALGADTEQRAGVRTLRATLANCHIRVRPDALRRDTADGTLIAARHLTGKPGQADHTDRRLALYRRAAVQTHPDAPVRVELRYLATGEVKVVAAPEKKQEMKWDADRLARYEKAAQGIQMRRFPARPESGDECRKCAYALICPC